LITPIKPGSTINFIVSHLDGSLPPTVAYRTFEGLKRKDEDDVAYLDFETIGLVVACLQLDDDKFAVKVLLSEPPRRVCDAMCVASFTPWGACIATLYRFNGPDTSGLDVHPNM
jgi:hypothetical protein